MSALRRQAMSGAATLTARTRSATCNVELAERRPGLRQPHEQRRRRPPLAQITMKRIDPGQNRREADLIRAEHRTAAIGGEPVAGQVDDVDVGGAGRDPVLEYPSAL